MSARRVLGINMRALTFLLTSAAVALAGAVILFTAWMTTIAYGPMPFWDAWEVSSLSRSWGRLWSLHNEHMITFPRLLYGLDTVLAKGTGKLSILFIWAFQLTSALLIARMARLQMWVAMSIAISMMFWGRHLENLSWSFQVGFIGLCFVAVLTMWLLQRSSMAADGIALAVGGTAAFWSLNGFLVPAIAAAHCMLNKRYAMAAAFISALMASLVIYIVSGFGTASGGAVKLPKLMHIAVVAFDIVGRPFAEVIVRPTAFADAAEGLGSLTGALIIAALLGPLIELWRSPSPRRAALIGVSLFGFGSCFMAAMGRAEDYTGSTEPAYRYAVFAVLGALPVLLMWLEKVEQRWLFSSLAAVIVCGLFAKNGEAWYPFALQRGTIEREAIAAIQASPDNVESYRLLYPSPERIREQIAYMRENGLGIF